jgi:hypothetical protein
MLVIVISSWVAAINTYTPAGCNTLPLVQEWCGKERECKRGSNCVCKEGVEACVAANGVTRCKVRYGVIWMFIAC